MKKQKYDNNMLAIVSVLFVLLVLSFGWGFGHMSSFFAGPLFMILAIVLIVWLIVSLTQK